MLTRRQRQIARWLADGGRIREFDDGDVFICYQGENHDLRLKTLNALKAAGLVRARDGAWVRGQRCIAEYVRKG